MDLPTDGQALCLQISSRQRGFPKPKPGVERFFGGRIRGCRVFWWHKGQSLCSKASASRPEAVREVFPSQNPALRGFPVAEFGAGGCSQGLYALRGFVCPQGTCMPSRDLYALKGFVCPQGTCMPSRDLYALKGLGPHGGLAHGAQVP